jgi:hypothetical protein
LASFAKIKDLATNSEKRRRSTKKYSYFVRLSGLSLSFVQILMQKGVVSLLRQLPFFYRPAAEAFCRF